MFTHFALAQSPANPPAISGMEDFKLENCKPNNSPTRNIADLRKAFNESMRLKRLERVEEQQGNPLSMPMGNGTLTPSKPSGTGLKGTLTVPWGGKGK